MHNNLNSQSDIWTEWLLHLRHGQNSEYGRNIQARIDQYADRVLEHAQLKPGMTIVDVGSGDGLIAFRAINQIDSSLQVILTDISKPMLDHVEQLANQFNVRQQCTFLECAADNLNAIADASIDAVMTRSVLAYVFDKTAALREFYRILKPGGRISFAEPVFRDESLIAKSLKQLVDAQPAGIDNLAIKLLHRWKSAHFPDTDEKISNNPISNYSERDLVDLAHQSGFTHIHLELHIDVIPVFAPSWEVFIHSSPHPWATPLNILLDEQFSPEERQLFEKIVRPTIESPQAVFTDRMAFLSAIKPGI